jgi:hypothetical protein
MLAGLDLVRQLDAGTPKALPRLAPTAFVPRKFWPALTGPDGTRDRRTGELGLAVAVRDGLRSGDLSLPASRRHVSCANLVYDPIRWTAERDHAYTELHLPQGPDDVVAHLQREFDDVAHQAEHGLSTNPCATIRANRVHLKRREALEVSPRLTQLRRAVEGALARVRIEDLLRQVDAWCGFTRAFQPPAERVPRIPNFTPTFLAPLIAHGTHLGLATMAPSGEGITADMLQEMSQWCLRAETLQAANAILVHYPHHVPLSAVWGDGTVSSSDGQRFGLQASSLLGSLSPRYYG